ncbi:hypothetical protein QTP86_029876, partial [Hemibagrus guttatus]
MGSHAPSVFQSFMNEIFRDMLHRFVMVYIDDILVYSPNHSNHVNHIKQVLNWLRHYHLYLKLEKCEFHQSTTQFLDYIISPKGIQMIAPKWRPLRAGHILVCKLAPLKGLPTALETAEALLNNVFRHFGIPEDIVSDRGPQFISRVWQRFFKLLGVSVSLSSGYHPQTNGQTERKIQEIRHYLMAYYYNHQHDWSQYLPWAEYAPRINQTNALSAHNRVPATFIPVDRETIREPEVPPPPKIDSISATQTASLPEAAAFLVGVPGSLETPVVEGLLSRRHRPQPRNHDPNHQNSSTDT